MTACDWNPATSSPAERVYVPIGEGYRPTDMQTGCRNDALFVVESTKGRPSLNLCASCAALERFGMCRKTRIGESADADIA